MASGEISPRHGRCLVGLSEKDQGSVLDEILANNLNVSDTEKIVKNVDQYFAGKKLRIKKKSRQNKQDEQPIVSLKI